MINYSFAIQDNAVTNVSLNLKSPGTLQFLSTSRENGAYTVDTYVTVTAGSDKVTLSFNNTHIANYPGYYKLTNNGTVVYQGTISVIRHTVAANGDLQAFIDQDTTKENAQNAAIAAAATKSYVDTSLANKVNVDGDQTVNGVKTFTTPPVVPTPTAANHPARKDYVDNAVSAGVADSGVTTAKLADNAVTTAKIAAGAVSLTKIAGTGGTNGQVLTTDGTNVAWSTAANPVTADNSITTAKLVDGAVTLAKIAGSAGTNGQVLTTNGSTVSWTTVSATGGASPTDATTTAKGIVQLTGDLGGTADAPTTPTAVHVTGAETIAGQKTFSNTPVFNAGTYYGEGTSITTGTTTGMKIGGSTTQKLGFFGNTPIAQQASSVDLGVVLSNFGFRTASTNYPLTTSGAVTLSGTLTSSSQLKVTGTLIYAPGAITGATTLTTTSPYFERCTSTAPYTITLPSTTTAGVTFLFKKAENNTNAITLAGTFDGATNYVLSSAYQTVRVVSTTTAGVWDVI